MNQTSRPALTEAMKKSFSGVILLDKMAEDPKRFHVSLMEQPDDELLEPVFKFLLDDGVVEMGDDDYYHPTEKGVKAYQALLHQQQSYLAHFDIYGRVDLGEGVFADPEKDYQDDSRFEDLRVSVGEYKGIDPHRMVFLAMVAEGHFTENLEWKFDIALGSSFFKEMEEIVQSQISLADLGYETEEGEWVSGEEVMEDIILSGAKTNQERIEAYREQEQASMLEEGDKDGEDEEEYMVGYDPYAPMGGYMGSPLFVEALWLSALW